MIFAMPSIVMFGIKLSFFQKRDILGTMFGLRLKSPTVSVLDNIRKKSSRQVEVVFGTEVCRRGSNKDCEGAP